MSSKTRTIKKDGLYIYISMLKDVEKSKGMLRRDTEIKPNLLYR